MATIKRSTSTDNLIESLTNTLAHLNQSFKAHLPQTNNQLRTSSNARNNATVQDDKLLFEDVEVGYKANNQGKTISERTLQRKSCNWEWSGGRTEDGKSSQIQNYYQRQESAYEMPEMLLYWMKSRLLVLAKENIFTNYDDDIGPPDYSKENLLATFAPQRNLTPEQIFWSIDENDRKKAKTSVPKPLSALTVFGNQKANCLNKTKQIWQPKGKLSDNSLNKTKQVWKATGKLFANVGYQWRPTGKKFTSGKLNCGYQWRPTGKKFALGELCPLTRLSVQCCSKHMTGNRSKLKNFVEKFIGSVRFGNDHFGAIMGYGDYVIGDSVISRVYYVEGNLDTNLFSLQMSIDDMMKSSPICLLSKASKSKSWLWHRRLNHLNFGTINDLARKDLVRGLPRLKFEKDHLCSACQLGKSKKFSHKPKSENINLNTLHTLLYTWICDGPNESPSINRRNTFSHRDDYSDLHG
ncbi:retrovirus-related pol polyprotein from transposon TNT 1-94 [Tanacetum coccineum]